MMTYIITLVAVPALCVLWILFQQWLAKSDPDYKGYKAGCGSCSRSCDHKSSAPQTKKTQFVDASSLLSSDRKNPAQFKST